MIQFYIYMYMRLLRWLSSERICLPIQKTQEAQVRSLGQEDPLEEEMATHSSILAWEISWTEEPGGLQFMGFQRVGHCGAARAGRQPELWVSPEMVGFPTPIR